MVIVQSVLVILSKSSSPGPGSASPSWRTKDSELDSSMKFWVCIEEAEEVEASCSKHHLTLGYLPQQCHVSHASFNCILNLEVFNV